MSTIVPGWVGLGAVSLVMTMWLKFAASAGSGAMALAWTMDKLGPIARAVEDSALVMQAIYGPDGADLNVRSAPFLWDPQIDWKRLRVGYAKSLFEEQSNSENAPEDATPTELN